MLSALLLSTAASAGAQIATGMRPPVERPLNPIAIDGRTPGPSPWREVADVRDRIDRGRNAGALPRREARRFDREARRIGASAARYGADGLSPGERRELEIRARVLREQVDARRMRGR